MSGKPTPHYVETEVTGDVPLTLDYVRAVEVAEFHRVRRGRRTEPARAGGRAGRRRPGSGCVAPSAGGDMLGAHRGAQARPRLGKVAR